MAELDKEISKVMLTNKFNKTTRTFGNKGSELLDRKKRENLKIPHGVGF